MGYRAMYKLGNQLSYPSGQPFALFFIVPAECLGRYRPALLLRIEPNDVTSQINDGRNRHAKGDNQ